MSFNKIIESNAVTFSDLGVSSPKHSKYDWAEHIWIEIPIKRGISMANKQYVSDKAKEAAKKVSDVDSIKVKSQGDIEEALYIALDNAVDKSTKY